MIGHGFVAYRRWSAAEDAAIRAGRARAASLSAIARGIGRTSDATKGRWFRIKGRAA